MADLDGANVADWERVIHPVTDTEGRRVVRPALVWLGHEVPITFHGSLFRHGAIELRSTDNQRQQIKKKRQVSEISHSTHQHT